MVLIRGVLFSRTEEKNVIHVVLNTRFDDIRVIVYKILVIFTYFGIHSLSVRPKVRKKSTAKTTRSTVPVTLIWSVVLLLSFSNGVPKCIIINLQ